MPRRLSGLIAAILLAAAVPVGAQEPEADAATKQRARAQFADGKRLFAKERFIEAAAAFEAAYRTLPHPAVMVNIALSYENAGRRVDAATWYVRYLENPVQGVDNDSIRRALAGLERALGRFEITCAVEECGIWIDGQDRGMAPATVFTEPGSHRVEAVVDGRVALVVVGRVDAGETRPLRLEVAPVSTTATTPDRPPEPEPEPAPAAVPPMNDTAPSLGVPFWIATGVTVAAGVGTAIFGALTLDAASTYESSGYTDAAAKEDGERDRLATNILAGVTAAGAVTAIALAINDLVFSTGSEPPVAAVISGPSTGIGAGVRF